MEPTPESKERIETFLREYGELVTKHGVDFANYPMFVPDDGGAFKVIMQSVPVDTKNQPVKSPFVQQA